MQGRIKIFTTGGTIDKVYFDASSQFEVGDSVLADLLAEAHVTADFGVCELMRKDSLDLDDADRQVILEAVSGCPERSVIITHGTDTMTVTAAELARVVDKTIVLTGALAPARFAKSDATFNVGMAFAAAQTLPPGVYIVMNGQVFAGDRVRKDRQGNRFVAF